MDQELRRPACRHGVDRRVLEACLERARRALSYGACERSTHQGGPWPQDRHDGLPVDSGVAPTWSVAWQLCSAFVDPRSPGSDANQNYAFSGTVQDQQPHPEAARERQHQARQHRDSPPWARADKRYWTRSSEAKTVQRNWRVSPWVSYGARYRNSSWRWRAVFAIITGSSWVAYFREYSLSRSRDPSARHTRLQHLGAQHQELADAVERWITVPGVERVAAWTLVAEIGPDMTAFPLCRTSGKLGRPMSRQP